MLRATHLPPRHRVRHPIPAQTRRRVPVLRTRRERPRLYLSVFRVVSGPVHLAGDDGRVSDGRARGQDLLGDGRLGGEGYPDHAGVSRL